MIGRPEAGRRGHGGSSLKVTGVVSRLSGSYMLWEWSPRTSPTGLRWQSRGGREVRLHMTKRWLLALLIAGLFGDKAFADCVPSPDTPASVIEYFQRFNKPLPEQFCAKEDAAPQAPEEPSQEPPQAYEDAPEPPPLQRRDQYDQLPPEYVPEPSYPPWPRHFEFRSPRFRFDFGY